MWISSLTTFVGSPTPRRDFYRYLNFAAAAAIVADARARVIELGMEELAPPRLEDCDRNTIELALGKPQAGFGGMQKYEGLSAKAVALTYGLAKSQACSDGNKRVALLLVVAFLRENGASLDAQRLEFAEMILSVATSDPARHDETIETARAWFAERIRDEEAA